MGDDGGNQRAFFEEFFAPVAAEHSLVITYLKHSPLQGTRGFRLLVGAAHVTGVTLPPMWNPDGTAPFDSSMWETIVTHSLRPKTQDAGILLPYQQLAALADGGHDVSAALAWAPEGRDVAFSSVTEHLTDDAALGALASLQRAAAALPALGLSVPDAALAWLKTQTAGCGSYAALGPRGRPRPPRRRARARAARELIAAAGDTNPWDLTQGVRRPDSPARRRAPAHTAHHRPGVDLPQRHRTRRAADALGHGRRRGPGRRPPPGPHRRPPRP
jgi:hypothetical protein